MPNYQATYAAEPPVQGFLLREPAGTYQYVIGVAGTGKSFMAKNQFLPAFRDAGQRVTVLDLGRSYSQGGFDGAVVTPHTAGQSDEWLSDPLAVMEFSELLDLPTTQGVQDRWVRAMQLLEQRMIDGGLLVVDEVAYLNRFGEDTTHPLVPLLRRFQAQGNVKFLFLLQNPHDVVPLWSAFPLSSVDDPRIILFKRQV